MTESIQLGDIAIDVTRKDVKHVHLSVHPPSGRVTLVAPKATRLEVARAYAASKLDGSGISRRSCVGRRERRRVSSSNARAITYGVGGICYPSSRRMRSRPCVSATAASR